MRQWVLVNAKLCFQVIVAHSLNKELTLNVLQKVERKLQKYIQINRSQENKYQLFMFVHFILVEAKYN